MKRPKLNFIIDIIAFFAFVLLTTTGILMRYILPPGSGKHALIWNMDRHEWGTIHFWISILFFSILALHLFTHWRWIVSLVKGRPKDQSGYRVGLGIVGVLAIILISIAPILTPIDNTSENRNITEKYGSSDEHDIRGSMTLNEIEHQILRKMNEPRIHFAINCASVSCPKLLNEAFIPEKLDEQLDRAAEEFINSKKNQITPGNIKISKIFKWFSEDFETDGSVIDFINQYAKTKVNKNEKIGYLDYNWNLNE